MRAHGAQQHVKAVRRMRIVHEHPCPGRRLAHQFKTALHGLEMRQAIGDLFEGQAERQGNRRCRQCIQGLELADQRQFQRFLLHIAPEQVQHLPCGARHDFVDPQILATPAERHDL